MKPDKLPISVFIITLNESDRIERTIAAVTDWVTEVVVVDSGSTDDTVSKARALGAKVFHHAWIGFGGQKRLAEDHCTQDWLLNLDSDEIVTRQLRDEILSLFDRGDPEPSGYKIKINNVYPGDQTPRPLAADYNVVRLYHKSAGRYRDHPVFDRVVLQDYIRPKQLKHPIHHFPLLDWQQMMEKVTRQSNSNLSSLTRKPRWLLILRLVTGFPLNFLRNYIVRRHFLGGWKGFVFALNTAYSRTMRIAKALAEKELHGKSDAKKRNTK